MAPQGLRAMGEPEERYVSGREKEYAGCFAAWEACLLLQNTLASGPLLSPVWHLHHRNPLETLAVALMWGKRQGSLCPPIYLSICLSIHHPSALLI